MLITEVHVVLGLPVPSLLREEGLVGQWTHRGGDKAKLDIFAGEQLSPAKSANTLVNCLALGNQLAEAS